MVSVGGLASGLDTSGIINQLVELERRPIQSLQRDITELQQLQATFTGISPSLSNLSASARELTLRNLDAPTASIIGSSEAFTVSATATATPGLHDLSVAQLATSARVASQGFADGDTTPISGAAGNFIVQLGSSGAQISVAVTTSTTMLDLANAINSAGGDISASLIDDGTNANSSRLVLSGGKTGLANDIRIVNNPTDLDFSTNQIEAASDDDDNAGTYTGTVTSSGTYTGTTNKTFLVEIMAGGAVEAATYRVSEDGGLTWDDNGGAGYTVSATTAAIGSNTEGVDIDFSNDASTLTAGDRFYVDVSTPVLSASRDAVFTLDGITQTRSTNSITNALSGVSIELQATTTSAVQFDVSVDDERIIEAVSGFVDAYNAVYEAVRSQQSFDTETYEAGLLLGDRTANTILAQMRNTLVRSVTGTGSSYDSLATLGITSSRTGTVEFDQADFREALAADRDGVLAVLASTESTSSSALTILRGPNEEQPGTYDISVSTAPQLASAVAGGAQADTLGGAETLSFTYSSNYTEASPSISSFSVALQAGDTLADVVNRLNSTFATQGARLRAYASANTLNIDTTEYGADMYFSVVSDTASGANTSRIGTTILSDQGVDIVGTINGLTATGTANLLTAPTDSDLAGLSVQYSGSSTGSVGTITMTSGIGSAFLQTHRNLTQGSDSVIGSRNAAIQAELDQLAERISDKEAQVARTQARLEEQFAALEVQLAGIQSQADFLTNQLGQLSGSGN